MSARVQSLAVEICRSTFSSLNRGVKPVHTTVSSLSRLAFFGLHFAFTLSATTPFSTFVSLFLQQTDLKLYFRQQQDGKPKSVCWYLRTPWHSSTPFKTQSFLHSSENNSYPRYESQKYFNSELALWDSKMGRQNTDSSAASCWKWKIIL